MKKIPHFFIVLVCILAAVQLKAADDFLPQSKWIGSEHCQSTPNTWLCFRKTVHLPGVPGEMIANIAVDSKYWLWINGKMVVLIHRDRKSTRLNSSHSGESRMPSSA